MRAVVIDHYIEDVSEIVVTEHPDPAPDADQYQIQVKACAANFFDLLQMRGKYQTQPPLPWIAGFEFAGIVLSAPVSGRPRFKAGDAVFGAVQGAYATLVCARESEIQPMPDGWEFETAAGLYFTAPTSYVALKYRANLQRGDYVLIHGASGGIGLAAVQMANALGGKVIAITTGTSNIAICKEFGAKHIIDYIAAPQWDQVVLKLTGGHGVDVVLDPVGLISQSLKCSAWCSRVVTVGFSGGTIESILLNRILLKNVSLVGIHWGAYVKNDPGTIPKVWNEIFDIIGNKNYRGISYHKRYRGLEEVSKALQGLERKEIWGKAVVSLSPRQSNEKL